MAARARGSGVGCREGDRNPCTKFSSHFTSYVQALVLLKVYSLVAREREPEHRIRRYALKQSYKSTIKLQRNSN
ncbi:Uncharacterized protein HZ326_10977 [Fusarium oxysporum f. sp. albedinis]|nr:Uncharacterized protein HZ326_10977 [Fusarium oxysporum f. sp. albedinis]